jgi:2-polyprenyl-3-methyl-5-hydroxy-6-metoxy-1,4-benzoquinol methylase
MTQQTDGTPSTQAKHLDRDSLDPDDHALVDSWDANVDFRADELANHADSAYEVLTTLLLDALSGLTSADSPVLDAGCGLGYLANSMAASGYTVEGVDPSRLSIEYAKKTFDSIKFSAQTIEQLASDYSHNASYGAVVANMVLHSTPKLDAFVAAAAKLIEPKGSLLASIPHPCFFLYTKNPTYSLFDYSAAQGFMMPFRIHGGRTHPEPVPYFQRTLEDYSTALHRAGFTNLQIQEPRQVGGGRHHDVVLLVASRKVQ